MNALLAKKLAQQVAEIRSSPDNKRCFNCESLGTTYYVPQFSTFVCTSCSGIHMQFGHRVKSVTLSDYKADEVDHMKEGGNQVAAYRYLAKYTPDKDLRKPIDRNPQRVRIWIQTVFVDKRFYNADAPIPRRSQDGSGAGTPVPLASPSNSLKTSLPSRESSLGTLPSPASRLPAAPAAGPHAVLTNSSSSPPVRDMRELLGDKVTAIHIGPRQHSEPASSATSRASSVTGVSTSGTPAAAAAITPQAPAKPVVQPEPQPAFDPFAVPESFGNISAGQPTVAAPAPAPAPQAAAFDPFQSPAPTPAVAAASAPAHSGTQAAAAQAASSNGWDSFGDVPAFAVPAVGPTTPAAQAQATAAAPPPAAVTPAASLPAAVTSNQWMSFEDNASENPDVPQGGSTATAPLAAAGGPQAIAAANAYSPSVVTADRSVSVPMQAAVTAPPVAATAASVPLPAPAAAAAVPATSVSSAPAAAAVSAPPAATAPAAAAAAPVTPTGSSKSGKPPAKELAADLFAEFTYPQPVAAALAPHPQAAAMQSQQMARPAALAGYQQPMGGMMAAPQQPVQYGMLPMGYGMPGQQAPIGMQQQQAMAWQQQQQAMVYQQQQAAMGMYGGYRPAMLQPGMPYGAVNGVMPGVVGAGQQSQQQEATSTSPSWVANTTTAGVTEENAFADLVDLKKALPAVSSPQSAAGAGLGYATHPQQPQQQPVMGMMGMQGMRSPGAAPYGMLGGFPAVPMAPQHVMMQQQQQVPYGMPPGVPGAYAAGMGVGHVPGSMGATPPSTSASTDSGNPFA